MAKQNQALKELKETKEKNAKLVDLVNAQDEKIRALEVTAEDTARLVAELKSKDTDTVGKEALGYDSLAIMFTNKNAFQLNDRPRYEFERIFFTFQREMKEVLVVEAERILPVDDLELVEGSILYNRYVEHAKKLKADTGEDLHGIQLSFRKY